MQSFAHGGDRARQGGRALVLAPHSEPEVVGRGPPPTPAGGSRGSSSTGGFLLENKEQRRTKARKWYIHTICRLNPKSCGSRASCSLRHPAAMWVAHLSSAQLSVCLSRIPHIRVDLKQIASNKQGSSTSASKGSQRPRCACEFNRPRVSACSPASTDASAVGSAPWCRGSAVRTGHSVSRSNDGQ